MTATQHVDTVVVGAGPGGLLCALELARRGRQVALVERGGAMRDSLCPKVAAGMLAHKGNLRRAERYRDQCPRCDCLSGVGGAAMHFDSNLGYVRTLSRPKIEEGAGGEAVRYNVLERLFGSMDLAQTLVAEGYSILSDFGLESPAAPTHADHGHIVAPELFAHTDTADSLPAPLRRTLEVVSAMEQAFIAAGGALRLHHSLQILEPLPSGAAHGARWRLGFEVDGALVDIHARNVVLALGKTAMPWIAETLAQLGVQHGPAATVDLGVRLETRRSDMEWMTRSCHNPKLSFLSARGEAVRTFCVCVGGRIMQYEFAGAMVLDGQHCIDDPTERTNFGVLTTVKSGLGVDAAAFGLDIARAVNAQANGGPLVQTVGDFLAGRATTSLEGNLIRSSLVRPALGDLTKALPAFLVADIRQMIERLNALSPGAIGPYALLAGPVIERAYPDIALDDRMECSRPGLFLAGDCSGKVIGITYAMATGLRAARTIVDAQQEVAA
jgi:uncharacterized FAD-dependent dehydrogenase